MKKTLVILVAVFFAVSLSAAANAQNGWGSATKPIGATKPAAAKPAAVAAVPATSQLTAAQVQQNPLVLLQQFTTTDLQAALADANAQNPPDVAGAQCYTALLALMNQGAGSPLAPPVGVFSALQKARDAKALLANLVSSNGPLSGLNMACAPLVLDAQSTVIGLGVGVGLVANPAGGAVALAGLPAGIAAFLAGIPKL